MSGPARNFSRTPARSPRSLPPESPQPTGKIRFLRRPNPPAAQSRPPPTWTAPAERERRRRCLEPAPPNSPRRPLPPATPPPQPKSAVPFQPAFPPQSIRSTSPLSGLTTPPFCFILTIDISCGIARRPVFDIIRPAQRAGQRGSASAKQGASQRRMTPRTPVRRTHEFWRARTNPRPPKPASLCGPISVPAHR